ncbi:MAG: hypothetical protein A3I61_07280 [Acidobacteria bacterium RIFCSPLOWO2_02_FULL_68_18]|nr:MAG: hypothetical protein A3I61_07280 [Acidobacteria bacterium RIFCSPLOWO2_02_FULL_68_18]OFW51310.1 MAG: hypothetical protein A3G77_05655 [Acidobacteria bacterium RIFCSPLOWO2_12_FULL_68_19]
MAISPRQASSVRSLALLGIVGLAVVADGCSVVPVIDASRAVPIPLTGDLVVGDEIDLRPYCLETGSRHPRSPV